MTRTKALFASVGLSLVFIVVYGGCIWITSRRGDIGTFYFQWERTIPFVPFMILPYMSIDLFFVAAPFLLRNDRELKLFSKRVTVAIVVAGVCFLLFPLRFAFPRPQAEGWLGVIFDGFRSIDAPYNLLPSLHAALCLLLMDVYARKLRGVAWVAVMVWFVFIGISPLLTYQHHLIDIIGGFILAGYCFYFFCESSPLPVVVNYRVGCYYVTASAMVLVLVLILWPWGALLLWPVIALSIVAAACFGVGPIIFRKQDGKVPWSTRFVLGPCLIGQYLSLLYYRRQCRSWDEVAPRIWMGGKLARGDANKAVQFGVTSVLDLSAEFSETESFREIDYRNIPVLDLTAPSQEQLCEMAEFIDQRSRDGIVYVHCKIGYSRSAAAIAAYLIMHDVTHTAAEAFAIIRRARPAIVVRSEIVTALSRFELLHASHFLLASKDNASS